MNVLGDRAIEQVKRLIREANARYRNPEPLRKRWFNSGGGGGCTSIICRPRADVDTGEVMLCDRQEGPILLETDTGETLIAINTGTLIAEGTRCEAIHYSCRKGGEAHMLSDGEIGSFQSSEAFSDVFPSSGLSSSGGIFAEYELFSLEC